MSTLFSDALARRNTRRPPVWLMRQAGRYHSHYMQLRKKHSFMEICKIPEVAAEATLGPIRDFDFDAAILFSDLLFPLEVMGMGLRYEVGPKLEWHLESSSDLKRLSGGAELVRGLSFQAEAMKRVRERLDPAKSLLGFVGGPLTLFFYAVEGSHQGELGSAHKGLTDGRFDGFVEKLLDLLAENMALQYRGGADAVAILDTCAGELNPPLYRETAVRALGELLRRFRERCPGAPVVYYSKKTGPDHWSSLENLGIQGLGIDWNHDIADILTRFGSRWSIQGNIDPEWMLMPEPELESKLRSTFTRVRKLPAEARKGWVCGLGHGVLPGTPEANVRLFLKLQKEIFR